jgi:dihydroneopterin aldolase
LYKIKIDNLQLKEIIGILEFERKEKQNILIHFSCMYEDKNKFINYADVIDFISADMKVNKYLLIEDALDSLLEKMKNKFIGMNNLYLKISKLDIIKNAIVSVEKEI